MDWKKYFEMMADWKCLPAYKAEPRIDSLVGYYLPEFMAEYLGQDIVGIIPELPIRKATVKPQLEKTFEADRSYKVDFYLLGTNGIHYLIEFKTDSGSRRENQDAYLMEAEGLGMNALVDGICQIAAVSTYKKKYNHLLTKMTDLGILDDNGKFSGKSNRIEIVYVQPAKGNETKMCVDFEWISQWLGRKYGGKEFEMEFTKALVKWSAD